MQCLRMFCAQLATVGIRRDSSCSSFSPTYIASMCNALLTMSSLILIVSLDGIPRFRSVISWIRSWSMLLEPSFIIYKQVSFVAWCTYSNNSRNSFLKASSFIQKLLNQFWIRAYSHAAVAQR